MSHPTQPTLQNAHFYGIIDTGYVAPDQLETKCAALLAGGAGIVQLRAKSENTAQRIAMLEKLVPLFTGRDVPLIVNDDLEAALAFPNVGLHVGQDDLSPEAARDALGAERILGLSTHSPEQASGAMDRADLLSYFAVGPVFPTQTKPDYTPVGLELVQFASAANPVFPWFCIGGINRRNVSSVVAAGGNRVVVVSDVLCADDTAQAVSSILKQMPQATRC